MLGDRHTHTHTHMYEEKMKEPARSGGFFLGGEHTHLHEKK